MKLLSISEFLNCKKHDSLVVLGSGYSLNSVTSELWETIDNNYDTFGMNWSCKLKRPVTWYLVREQCASAKRLEDGHLLCDFYEEMRHCNGATKVVKDMGYRTNNYQHTRNLDRIEGEGYVFNEIQGGCSVKSFRDDIFTEGIHHGKCSMYDALHFAIGMKYEKIVLCGVDLYDNRYFYLPFNQTLKQTEFEGQHIDDPHRTAGKAIQLFKDFAAYWKVPTFVHNYNSLLSTVLPVWDKT